MTHPVRVAVCILLLAISGLLPGSACASTDSEDHPGRFFAFAESLFIEGDYYRAITEYKRVIFHFPSAPPVEICHFRIGESYFRAKRWTEAALALQQAIDRYPSGPFTSRARYLKGLAEKELKQYEKALESFESLKGDLSDDLADRAAYQQALIFIEREDWNSAKTAFRRISPGSPIHSRIQAMTAGLDLVDAIPRKSPAIAGTLAAMLPGAGHLYTERPKDAAVAFLLNAAFMAAAVELFRKDNNILGGIVTFVEAGWYLGNIYSAVNTAHKYNRDRKNGFFQRLKDEAAISFHYHPPSAAANIMIRAAF